MISPLCRVGFHSWPRTHGEWRQPVVEPTTANCRRCQKVIASIWRVVYPSDGSKCGRSCQIHGRRAKKTAQSNP
jgi:hypothetical protein